MKSPRRKRAAARAEAIAAVSHGSQLATMLQQQRAVLARLRTAHAREPDPHRKAALATEIAHVENVTGIHERDLADAIAAGEAERASV